MLRKIRDDIEAAFDNNKTPLFVDTSSDESLLNLLRSHADFVILDAKKIHWENSVKKFTIDDILERCRALLVFAMRRGRILVVRMQGTSADFLQTFNDDAVPELGQSNQSCFPIEIFRRCGHIAYSDDDVCMRLHRREDREPKGTGRAVCDPKFRLIVTTTIAPNLVHDMLFNGSFGLPDRDWFEIIELY